METPNSPVSLKVATYKLQFHGTNNWQAVAQRLDSVPAIDIWCLQGAAAKNLKALPDTFAKSGSRGLAFVSRNASVHLHCEAYVNVSSLVLEASLRCSAVADAVPVSSHHLRKLQLFAGFAAFDVLAQRPGGTATTPRRVLVVNVDLQQVRNWGQQFHAAVVQVLCDQVWGGVRGYTQMWECQHVCLAGCFFFAPASTPYAMLTSRSGGVREVVDAATAAGPFVCCSPCDKEGSGDSGPCVATHTCVVGATAQRVGELQELLGVRVDEDGGAGQLPVSGLQAYVRRRAADSDEVLPLTSPTVDGWWTLANPLDTSAAGEVVLRLEWTAPAVDGEVAVVGGGSSPGPSGPAPAARVRLLVRSHGVLPPWQKQYPAHRAGDDSAPLLVSALAGTCTGDSAAEDAARCLQERGWTVDVRSGAARDCGEPPLTALYQTGVDVVPGCHDYIFTTAFTGASVMATVAPTVAELEREVVTAHLPLRACLALPNPDEGVRHAQGHGALLL
ncbi:hypothetical protein NESM_000856900 [Novymonas esmeraldas]|uniref:Uncharacterized protein n=1 Tax=Novymonas esmeraldas TaxID=1808958 RepID=A0AAW0F1H9_9TRYP